MVVRSWWAGARRFGGGLDLVRLAEEVGGFAALEAGGVRSLIAAGVAAERAQAWVRAPEQPTPWRVVTLADGAYPRSLRSVPGAPPVLEVEGDIEVLQRRSVAVVGTRRCTGYGAAVARHIGHATAKAGATVVSGLAWGIDAQAHRAALEVGATAAVVAHGLDHTAPAGHRRLREAIVGSGGAVVSTWPPGVPPQPWRFPVRNQWVAALAEAVVVVEAPARSGALITASRAAELARDVVVVPGRLGDEASRGCLRLLSEGAEPMLDVEEWVRARFHTQPDGREPWLAALFAGSSVEEVARRWGADAVDLNRDLAMRELGGEVVRLPGQRYAPGRSSP